MWTTINIRFFLSLDRGAGGIPSKRNGKMFSRFMRKHESFREVMMDHELAALGDSLVNFLYSLTLSIRYGKPRGVRVDGRILSDAISKADLRRLLPSKLDRHMKADAAEALIAYAWMRNVFSIEDAVEILSSIEDASDAFSQLLIKAKEGLEKIWLNRK